MAIPLFIISIMISNDSLQNTSMHNLIENGQEIMQSASENEDYEEISQQANENEDYQENIHTVNEREEHQKYLQQTSENEEYEDISKPTNDSDYQKNSQEENKENVFYAKKDEFCTYSLKKAPGLKTFDQSVTLYQKFLLKKSKPRSFRVDFSCLNDSKNINEKKKEDNKENDEFDEELDTTELELFDYNKLRREQCNENIIRCISDISNNKLILKTGRNIRNSLMKGRSIQSGIFFLANEIYESFKENPGENKPVFFGFMLSSVFPEVDDNQTLFERYIYHFSELANPYKASTKKFALESYDDSNNDVIVEEAKKGTSLVRVLFAYWSHTKQTDKLFKWGTNHSKYINEVPNCWNGLALDYLIKFSGCLLYNTDKKKTSEMANRIQIFLDSSFNYPGFKEKAAFYRSFKTHYETFNRLINDEKMKEEEKEQKLVDHYDKYKKAIKYYDENE